MCGGWIEIKTDPQRGEYVVVEGARRRDYGVEYDEEQVGLRGAVNEEEKERLERDGGFAGLEKKVEDKRAGQAAKERLEELTRVSGRDWADPYERSQLLRREFRLGRRTRKEDETTGEALKERFGIEIQMLPGNEEDGERAKGIDFGSYNTREPNTKPLFEEQRPLASNDEKKIKTPSPGLKTAQAKSTLQSSIKTNTRATVDPFLRHETAWHPRAKRKRNETTSDEKAEKQLPAPTATTLVDYDSDFE